MYCYRDIAGNLYYCMVPSWTPYFTKEKFWNNFPHDYRPIWSVGQLLYILKECIGRDDDKEVIFMDLTYKQGPIIGLLMDIFNDKPVMNLSKLED